MTAILLFGIGFCGGKILNILEKKLQSFKVKAA